MLHQPRDRNLRIFDQGKAGADDFVQIVRRYIGRHPNGDAGRAIYQQIRHSRRQHHRFGFGLVVVRNEVDCFLVDVGQQLVREPRHPDLRVAHGRGRVPVHRTEIALPIDQQIAE